MITVEFWGPAKTEYGPVLRKNSEEKTSLQNAYNYAKAENEVSQNNGFIRIMVNGKWVPTYYFMEQYRKTHPTKPNLKVYWESGDKFVLIDNDTKEEVFAGNKWEVEKYLDEHGYFEDDYPKFGI